MLFATCFSAKAQIAASDWMVGGGARFFATKIAGEYTANVELSVDGAYLIQFNNETNDKNFGTLVVGLRPSFSWDPINHRYRAVVFARYYYNFKNVSPFAEVNIGYNLVNTFEDLNGDLVFYTESLVLGAKVGGAFYITPNVTFDAFFFYDHLNENIHDSDKDKIGENTQFALGLGLGFQIFLQCKK